MAVKPLTSLLGQNAGVRLAPQLDYFSTRAASSVPYQQLGGLDITAGLTTVVSLTGKFEILGIWANLIGAADIDQIKMTIDGIVVSDSDEWRGNTTVMNPYGASDMDNGLARFRCDESFLFQMEADSDASMTFTYSVRAIL